MQNSRIHLNLTNSVKHQRDSLLSGRFADRVLCGKPAEVLFHSAYAAEEVDTLNVTPVNVFGCF